MTFQQFCHFPHFFPFSITLSLSRFFLLSYSSDFVVDLTKAVLLFHVRDIYSSTYNFFFFFYSGAAHNMTSFYKFVFVCQSVKPRFSIHFISLSMRLHTLFLSPSLCLCILYISTSLYICPHYITSTTFISMQRALVKYYRHVHYFNIRFTGMCTSGIILYAYI